MVTEKYEVSCIEREEDWRTIEGDWKRLVRESERATLFSDWEWTRTWWEVFSSSAHRLRIIVVSAAGRVVGIVPLYTLSTTLVEGLVVVRVLRLLGTGEVAEDEVSTEYGDIIASPGLEEEVARESVSFIFGALGREWDMAVFDNVLERAAIVKYLVPTAVRLGGLSAALPIGRRYFVELPENWNTYLGALSKRTRSNLLAAQRRMARQACASIELHSGGAEVLEAFDRLAVLHSRRWRERGKAGAFASARFVHFHRCLLNRPQGPCQIWARLWILTIDKQDVAAVYALEQHNQLHIYQTGIDPHNYKYLSPGLLLLCEALSWSIGRRLRVFDLMLSKSTDYKAKFSLNTAGMSRALVFNNSIKGLGVYVAWRIRRGCGRILGAAKGFYERRTGTAEL